MMDEIERTPSGPYSYEEARALNNMGTRTGGCAECVREHATPSSNGSALVPDRRARTQWKFESLRQDPRWPHRFLCPAHLERAKRAP